MAERRPKITRFSGNVQRLTAPEGYVLKVRDYGGQLRHNARTRDILFSVVRERRSR